MTKPRKFADRLSRNPDPSASPASGSRRRFVRSVAALGGAGLLPAGAPLWAQQGGAPAVARGTTLTLSLWGGVTQDAVRDHVAREFEKMTGATLAYDIGGQGARYNKLLAQRNNPPADVFFSTDEAVVSGHRAGVLMPARRANVANAGQLYDWAVVPSRGLTPDGTLPGVAYALIAYVIGYNPDVVKSRPTSWADLWRPEFRGKLAFAAPGHSQMPAFVITAAEMSGGSQQNVDPGFKKLAELRPSKLTFFWTDWAQMHKSGDVVIGTEFDYYLETMKSQKYPIEWVTPKEKGFGSPQCMSIVRGAKNPELAEAFINLMLDPKVQLPFAAETFQGITNRTVKLSPAQMAKCTCGARMDQLRFFDPVMAAGVRAQWTERMNTEVVPNWGKR